MYSFDDEDKTKIFRSGIAFPVDKCIPGIFPIQMQEAFSCLDLFPAELMNWY